MNRSNRIDKNIQHRKRMEEFKTLSNQILKYASRGILRPDFQREISRMILEFSGCEAVELWIRDHGKYYRCEVKRNLNQSFSFDISLCFQNEKEEVIPGPDDDPEWVSLCGDIVRGHLDPSQPDLTRNGSFWTDHHKKPPTLRSMPNDKSHVRVVNFCCHYQSFALIPLSVDNKNIGLLILKSKPKGFFKKNERGLYEDLAQSIGIALAHRRAQSDLRERVKELTCLYGIARLATQTNIPVEEILQNIAELLPPALLYPEITFSRILLDGRSYSIASFIEGYHQLRSDININGIHRGFVEVAYIEEKPELDEGPFLKEERNLIDAVAKEVAIIIVRRQAEQEKLELQEQLRHAERLATIGQFSAGVAHELNEPLGNILGFAQLAKKCSGLPKQAELDIEKILTASLNAREVVKKLLIFARKLPPRKTNVNLNRLVEEGLNFFESRCAKEGIELLRSLSPDLPEIPADPAQLNQVIVNLIINALQAMKTGGRLTIRTLAGKEHLSLIVEDTGIGMDEEVIKQIFTPFFTTKDIGQGTGLGLPVVHGIVASHGGSINVESKLNQGSRFEIQLPVTGSPEVEVGK